METNLTPFRDMDGNPVTVGDKIVIVHDYNYQFHNGQEATVIWNERYGCYEWTFTEVRRGKSFTNRNDFCGIHQFKLIK